MAAAGLRLGSGAVDRGPSGQVLTQHPSAGSMVPAGTAIGYTIGGRPPAGHECN